MPFFERCERPSSAPLRRSVLQPGCLAQGPEEKNGRAGRTAGRSLLILIPSRMMRFVGEAWPTVLVENWPAAVNRVRGLSSPLRRIFANRRQLALPQISARRDRSVIQIRFDFESGREKRKECG